MSVCTVTEIVGIKPADEQYKKMLEVFDSCKAAGVEYPESIKEFFCLYDYENDYVPPHSGMKIDLMELPKLIKKKEMKNMMMGRIMI